MGFCGLTMDRENSTTLRILLFVLNLILCFMGIVYMGGGSYMFYFLYHLYVLKTKYIFYISLCLLIFSLLAFLSIGFGTLALLTNKGKLLAFFGVFMLILAAADIFTGVFSFSAGLTFNKDDGFEDHLKETMKDYDNKQSNDSKVAWDWIQSTLECCATGDSARSQLWSRLNFIGRESCCEMDELVEDRDAFIAQHCSASSAQDDLKLYTDDCGPKTVEALTLMFQCMGIGLVGSGLVAVLLAAGLFFLANRRRARTDSERENEERRRLRQDNKAAQQIQLVGREATEMDDIQESSAEAADGGTLKVEFTKEGKRDDSSDATCS